jgi:hypothetical protein
MVFTKGCLFIVPLFFVETAHAGEPTLSSQMQAQPFSAS